MLCCVSVLVVLCATRAAARLVRRDQTYSTSVRDSTYAQSFGIHDQLTTVNAGVYRWLSGGGTHNFFGNLNNYGSITISQTDYLVSHPSAGGQTSDFVGHDVNNGNLNNYGLISLNDYGSASAPTYDWYLATMENAGSMQWCGRGDTGGSTYQLYCDGTCYNDGVLDFEQYNSNLGASFNWRNTHLYSQGSTVTENIYNNGAFRLVNVNFQAVQNVLGNGCWVLGVGSTLYMQDGTGAFQNSGYGPTFPNQNIYFTDSTATLHMDTQVYSHNSNFGPQLYGFGSGNAIEFYETISTFAYDVTTGLLTVTMTSNNKVLIKLGAGYTASGFTRAAHPSKYNSAGYNAIFYSAAAPSQTIPSQCSVSLGVCADPAATAASAPYSTTTLAYTGAQTLTGPLTQTVASASGTAAGTVVVYTPAGNYATTTQLYTGPGTLTGLSTVTAVQATGTTPGTIIVYTPATYITATLMYTGSSILTGPITSTIAQPSGTNPGTIAIYTPGAYVTTTQLYTGMDTLTSPLTSTVAQAAGTTPGTVVVFTPGTYATTTLLYTGPGVLTAPLTSTIAAASGTTPGTVAVYTPGQYATTTLPYTGVATLTAPLTSTIAQPSGTSPGTVAVFTPANRAFVTTTLVYTGTDALAGPSTSTIAPQVGTTPGTIAVFTPAAPTYVTYTVSYTETSALTAPLTSTVASQAGTTPGTVIIFTRSRPASLPTAIGSNQCLCVPL